VLALLLLPTWVLGDVLVLKYVPVDLDAYIAQQQPTSPGSRTILMPSGVEMLATVMRYPEKRAVKYLYTALEMMHVSPLPKVNHRMFIRSLEGRIIPVYVEDDSVHFIKKGLKEGEQARFRGYHVYNYSKGPALVIEGFEKL
jgi:hypothetical protein